MDLSYLSLEGKVALITGGSRGIGRAIALAFSDAGADIVISSRKQPGLDQVAAEIKELGGNALPIAAHCRKPEEINQLVEAVKTEYGRLDILVNNAATNPVFGPLLDVEERAFDVIMDTNLKGTFLLSQMAARMMIKQGEGGQIINISSIGGLSPERGLGVYSISKAAINMLTKVMAMELGAFNIRVNALAPGVVRTHFSRALWDNEIFMEEAMKRTPLNRIAEPEEIARIALMIASGGGSYMTGQVVVVDGGFLI